MKRVISAFLLVWVLCGCSAENVSPKAADALLRMLQTEKNSIEYDSFEYKHKVITDSELAVIISSDFQETMDDVEVAVNVEPFISAGLIPETLPAGMYYSEEKKLVLKSSAGDTRMKVEKEPTLQGTLSNLGAEYLNLFKYYSKTKQYYMCVGEHGYLMWPEGGSGKIKVLVKAEALSFSNTNMENVQGWALKEYVLKDTNGKSQKDMWLEKEF